MISHHDSGHANCYFVATLWHSPTFPANWDYVILLQNVSTRRSWGILQEKGLCQKDGKLIVWARPGLVWGLLSLWIYCFDDYFSIRTWLFFWLSVLSVNIRMLYTLVSHSWPPRLKTKGIYQDSKSIQHNKPQSICTVDQKTMSRIDHSGPHTFLEVWHEEMARAESRAKKDPGIEPGQVERTKSRHTSGQNLNVIRNCSSTKQTPQQRDLNNRCEEARSILICTIVPKSDGRGISFALFILLMSLSHYQKQVLWGRESNSFGGVWFTLIQGVFIIQPWSMGSNQISVMRKCIQFAPFLVQFTKFALMEHKMYEHKKRHLRSSLWFHP